MTEDEDISLRQIVVQVAALVIGSCGLLMAWAYVSITYFMPPPYDGVTLQPGVVYVSARRFETDGLERLSANGTAIDLTPWSAKGLEPTVTVLVHGYNTQEHKIAAYFSELAAYLQADGHYRGSIVVFDWPTVGVPLDELPTAQRVQLEMLARDRPVQPGYELAMYGIDQRRAGDIGARTFLALLDTLTKANVRTINVVGHSMGCQLLAEALKLEPAVASRIAAMVWLAPDVDEAIVDAPWLGSAIDHLQNGMTVYYSRNDTVLTRLSRLANGTGRLGATGPGAHTPPRKMAFLDMTDALGPESPHTRYLAKGSPSLERIAKAIEPAH